MSDSRPGRSHPGGRRPRRRSPAKSAAQPVPSASASSTEPTVPDPRLETASLSEPEANTTTGDMVRIPLQSTKQRRAAARQRQQQVYAKRRELAVTVLVVLGMLGGVWLLGQWDRSAPAAYNGMLLGRDGTESVAQYRLRAAAALDALDPSDPTAHFALVTLQGQFSAAATGQLLGGVALPRVNALIAGASAPVALPEPVMGESRGEVLARWLEAARATGKVVGEAGIDSVVVYAPAAQLKQLEQLPEVFAVEPAPVQAAWGQLGVQPVYRTTSRGPAQ